MVMSLTRDELLQRPEILNYLRRNGQERKKEDLLSRFYTAVKGNELTKEIVLSIEQRLRGRPRKDKILQERKLKKYLYDNEFLTRDELLQKPEILKYLRRGGKEKNDAVLLARFYKALYAGNITKENVEREDINRKRVKKVTCYDKITKWKKK